MTLSTARRTVLLWKEKGEKLRSVRTRASAVPNHVPKKNNTYTAKKHLIQDSYESNIVSFPSHYTAFRPRAPCSCCAASGPDCGESSADWDCLCRRTASFSSFVQHVTLSQISTPSDHMEPRLVHRWTTAGRPSVGLEQIPTNRKVMKARDWNLRPFLKINPVVTRQSDEEATGGGRSLTRLVQFWVCRNEKGGARDQEPRKG